VALFVRIVRSMTPTVCFHNKPASNPLGKMSFVQHCHNVIWVPRIAFMHFCYHFYFPSTTLARWLWHSLSTNSSTHTHVWFKKGTHDQYLYSSFRSQLL
jgi:hypothetical protein